jgi:glutathionyl-hydroquinone reductase
MLRGLELFKEHFAEFSDRYVLIGGTACTLAMKEAGLDFRATKDLDIVLCIETLDPAFGKAFWEFIKKGGYQHRQKSTGKELFYELSSSTLPLGF